MTQPLTKRCIKCEQTLPLSSFRRQRENRGGYDLRCRPCYETHYNRRDPHEVFARLHEAMETASERNGYAPLAYSVEQLKAWAAAQQDLEANWAAYANSKYKLALRPALTRIDPSQPFSLKNLTLTARGASIPTAQRPVVATHLDGMFHKGYASVAEAARDVDGKIASIRAVANGEWMKNGLGTRSTPKSHRDFVWRWL